MCVFVLSVFAEETLFTPNLKGWNTPLFREGVEAEAKMMLHCEIGLNVMLSRHKQTESVLLLSRNCS